MKKAFRIHVIAITLLVGALTLAVCPAWGEEKKERVMIGRISFVEGQLLRYVHEEQDWVAVVKDAPFGLNDALYSDQQSRAEFIMPNNTWIRIGGNTQIQVIALKNDVTEVDVASGMTRFYNKGESAVIKATTPFGYVVAYGGTAFDLYVGDTSVEVLAIGGTVDFVHQADGSRYEVTAGESSVLADAKDIAAGDGLVDADWDDWNQKRDQSWQKRVDVKGDSYEYLPSSLKYESDVFEENGKWEKVQYQGESRTMWRPTRVSSSWAPYSDGRWSVYNGDNCWIPDEPFGYTTHHQGSWIREESCGCWYWAPPVRRTVVQVEQRPDYYEDDCECDWYPGRVAWIHSQEDVGWIPLTPSEPYYTNNYWGGLSVVVSDVASVAINIGSYYNYNHAVIVNQNDFYNVNNYNNVRVTNINNTTIINNYHGAAVVNNTVVNNFNTNRNRYNFTNVNVQRTPHESVVKRIERNQGFARETRNIGSADIGRDLSGFRAGRFDRTKQIDTPRVSSRLVDRQNVNKPLTDMQLPQREVRQKGRQAEPISNKILRGPDAAGQGRAARGADGFGTGASGTTREGLAGPRPHGPRQDIQQDQPGRTGQVETGRNGLRPGRPDFGKDRRGADQAGVDPGGAGQGERGNLRPVRPGLGRDRIGTDQGTTGQDATGQAGKAGLRPVRPGHGAVDQGSGDQGSQGLRDTGRVRPPRFGQEPPPGGPEGAGQDATGQAGKAGLRPVRPGHGAVDQGSGDLGSQGLKDTGRVRPPRPGQEPQSGGADPGAAPGSDRNKLRPVRPGVDSQPGDTGGSLKDQRRQQMMDQRQQQQDAQQPQQGQSRRQQMEQQQQQRQQQQETQRQQQQQQRQQQEQSRRQQMEQQQQQRQQQQETQRQQQQQQRQQQQETQRQQQQQQRQQQQQQRQQQQETQRQQQEQSRRQQMEQQQQQRQQQQETQRQQQQQQRQQQQETQRQQQQQQRQQQQEAQRQQQQQQQQQQRQQQQEAQRQQQQQQRQQQQEAQRQQQQQQQQQQRQQQIQQQQQQQQQRQQQQEAQRQQQQQQRQQQIQQQQQQRQQQNQQQQQKKRGQQDPNQPVQ